jgi:SAM-dependent methyltransferase
VQFVYEHALARIELVHGFGCARVEVDPFQPWEWSISEPAKGVDDLLARSAYVAEVDGKAAVYGRLIKPAYQGGTYNRTRSVNQYLTHWIYPYRGKFHPQMIRAILNLTGLGPGARVLDPFVGSGTTALECRVLGIDCVGVDVSPLCARLARVKTLSIEAVAAIRKAVSSILSSSRRPDLERLDPARFDDARVREFVEIALMVTTSDVARRRREPAPALEKNLRNMLESVEHFARARDELGLRLGAVEIREGDSRQLGDLGLGEKSIDAVVTSPPYSIALDYVKNDAHALAALGHDPKKIREGFVGVRGRGAKQKLALYNDDLRASFREWARVLKPGGRAVVVIGDATVDGSEVTTTREMIEWAEAAGLRFERELPKIVFGLYSVMQDEKILFFRR